MSTAINDQGMTMLYDSLFFSGGSTALLTDTGVATYADTGFAVSVDSVQRTVSAEAPPEDFRDLVNLTLAEYDPSALGVWLERGLVYVDPVQIFYAEAVAEHFARERGQIAFYDLAASETHYVDYSDVKAEG